MKKTPKPRVVIDTNVWISALIFGGLPGKILELFINENIEVVASEECLSELRRKITAKFALYTPKLDLLAASIREDGIIVGLGAVDINVCRDPDDNKFIETALIGDCSYIISGDKDLLALKSYKNIQIVAPAEFLGIFKT